MEDDLNILVNRIQPLTMESDLNYLLMEDDLKFLIEEIQKQYQPKEKLAPA